MIIEVGAKFNRWTYIGTSTRPDKGYGVFQCDCGEIKDVYIFNVISGKSLSCGRCKHVSRGLLQEDYLSIVSARSRAIQRCYNPNYASYSTHGERGIRVCDEWLDSVSDFVDWALENGWEKGLTLDRTDNDGHYTPENCRWADWKTQGRNRRSCIYFERDGERKCMGEWCELLEIPYYLAYNRYKRGALDFGTVFYQGNLQRR